MMKREIRIFFTALMFFTRIPCPKWVDHSPEYLQKSSRYFPLIGVIVGAIGGIVYILSAFIFPKSIAILLSMIATIYITGAFHEDGLADMCDGFGGGWTKEDILRIMKDSRMGTYGTIGLFSVLALKYAALYQVSTHRVCVSHTRCGMGFEIPLVLIAGHALSRFAASTLLYTHDYVREESQSKVKPAAVCMSTGSLLVGAVFGIIPIFLFFNPYFFLLLIPVFAARWYLGNVFARRIGGQTGDCLGATQQICEVVFYLSFIALWKFI